MAGGKHRRHHQQAVRADGRTPYERIKGKRHHGDFCEFGSQVFHRIPTKPQGSMMLPRWANGTWLGKRWNSDEHLIGMEAGAVVRTRSVRGRSSNEMWSAAAVRGVKGRPWDPLGTLTYEKLHESTDPAKIPEVPRAPAGRGAKDSCATELQDHRGDDPEARHYGWVSKVRRH